MDKKLAPSDPLRKIALSCSGGGYRATAFHMGSMSYLNRVKYSGESLLRNVEMLSTVSGGSITGIVYAVGLQQGKDFETIYSELRDKLSKLDLLKEGFTMLNEENLWTNEFKSQNLINAFALLYDKHFTNGFTLGSLKKETHLKNIVFNSTEFNNAINFRFKSNPIGYSGNYYNRIPQSFHPHIKLSDIMASSSCFPGGFEPIIWPADFRYKEVVDNGIFDKDKIADTGLMDGGIYDNQGIESILNYKKDEKPYFDLIIISDVASPYMNPFKAVSRDKKVKGWKLITLKMLYARFIKLNKVINLIALAFLMFCLACLLANGFSNTIITGICITISIFLATFLVAKAIVLFFLRNKICNYLNTVKNGKLKFYIEKIGNLRIEELSYQSIEPLIINRLNSVIILLMDVFLKVTRRLNYDKLYEDEVYEKRRISNLVNELTQFDYENKLTREKKKPSESHFIGLLTGDYNDVVGINIKEVAESAAGFGTTLWFTDENRLGQMLDKLLATGQFTMCYNLILYLEKLITPENTEYQELEDSVKDELVSLHKFCLDDWEKFKSKPMIMVSDLKF